jgi:triosephosphate isomerase
MHYKHEIFRGQLSIALKSIKAGDSMKKLIAGNWKMNGSRDDARALISGIVNALSEDQATLDKADVLVCPPALYINDVRHALHGFPAITFGGQDISAHEKGAYTGELSAAMMKDSGCRYVILGHSERRQYHGETDALVSKKAEIALANDLIPIICVGESESQREDGHQERVVAQQLKDSLPTTLQNFHDIVVAYEPVWAIGTGKTASADDVEAMHSFIRTQLQSLVPDAANVRILYGGSMKPDNAGELLSRPNVDGGLIGGASLSAESFLAIAKAA